MRHQLTVRYDDRLAREIEELTRREGISRNQAVVRLLRKGAEIEEPTSSRRIGDSLDCSPRGATLFLRFLRRSQGSFPSKRRYGT